MSENQEEKSLIKRISSFFYTIIFEIPTKEYYSLYKTGKIQNMSQNDKIKMVTEVHRDKMARQFFKTLIMIRPNILDDSDKFELALKQKSIKRIRYVLIGGVFFTGSYFIYRIGMRKSFNFMNFFIINGVLSILYIIHNFYIENYYETLYRKYGDIIKKDDMFNMMRKSYNID